jgi:N-acetylglutamate synthase-like GNAT family acetyltransferase
LDLNTREIAGLTDVTILTGKTKTTSQRVFEINRINVPPTHRGRKLGSTLLKKITADADQTNTILVLNILSYGPLDPKALTAWYHRHGFESTNNPNDWHMRRHPQSKPNQTCRQHNTRLTAQNRIPHQTTSKKLWTPQGTPQKCPCIQTIQPQNMRFTTGTSHSPRKTADITAAARHKVQPVGLQMPSTISIHHELRRNP